MDEVYILSPPVIRLPIRQITESILRKSRAVVGIIYFGNALEGWNYFTSLALWPMAESIRDELERNGYNRHTGAKEGKP